MQATIRTNGKSSYALGVSIANRSQFFDPNWTQFHLEIDGALYPIHITPSFWRKNPTLRHPALRAWLERHGLLNWAPYQTPKVTLTPLGGSLFRLENASVHP